MRKMRCEICDGTDIIKQNGYFACRGCGAKYTVEEARNLLTTIDDYSIEQVKEKATIESTQDSNLSEKDSGNADIFHSISAKPLQREDRTSVPKREKEHIKKRISIIAIASLLISLLGILVYSTLFSETRFDFRVIFIVVSIISILLPPVSKIIRKKKGTAGKAFEILAVIVGGFNVYCCIFALTSLPIITAYLGWIIGGIAYAVIDKLE